MGVATKGGVIEACGFTCTCNTRGGAQLLHGLLGVGGCRDRGVHLTEVSAEGA